MFALQIRWNRRCEQHNNVFMNNEMHSSYNQFYSTVFRLLYMFLMNLVVHHQEHSVIYCITQIGTIVL